MKPFVFRDLSARWIVGSVVLFVGLLLYGFTGLDYELLFLPLYPLLAVFWIVGKLRERSDADRSTGSH